MKLRSVAAGVLVCVVVASAASAQSLGDIARKLAVEREAKAKEGKAPPAITVTNKDLTDVSPPGGGTPAKPAGEAKAAVKAKPAATPASAKDEAYWRARMLPLRDKLLSDRGSSAVAAKRLADLRYNLTANQPSAAASRAEKAKLTTETQNWNVVLDADLQAIAELREEGRRAGAPPGWFR